MTGLARDTIRMQVLEQRESQVMHLSEEYGKLQSENERLVARLTALARELQVASQREKVCM
jgi:hypothetical protein